MPQWLTNLGSPDLHGPWLIVIAAIAALLVLYLLYRVVFGHRLRVPSGGRTRQPRLGLVDAFSLDGQRQLVLVRRDNVEHLIMIGGPTDVLVESQIIRVSAPSTATAAREREVVAPVKLAPAAPPAPAAPAIAAPAPAERPPAPVLAVAPPTTAPSPRAEGPQQRILKPAPTVAAESTPVLRRPETAPKPRELGPAPQQRPPTPSRQDSGTVASRVIASEPEASVIVPIKPPVLAPVATPARAPQSARPTLPPPIGTIAPTARANAPAATREAPVAKPQQSIALAPASATPARPPKAPDAFADLESLEAEMARLLGRDA